MTQLTVRLDEETVRALKDEARRQGRSLNSLITSAVTALVDPSAAGDEMDRIRERFRRAGILAEPVVFTGKRPDAESLARAMRAAAKGKSLSDLVSEDRG